MLLHRLHSYVHSDPDPRSVHKATSRPSRFLGLSFFFLEYISPLLAAYLMAILSGVVVLSRVSYSKPIFSMHLIFYVYIFLYILFILFGINMVVLEENIYPAVTFT